MYIQTSIFRKIKHRLRKDLSIRSGNDHIRFIRRDLLKSFFIPEGIWLPYFDPVLFRFHFCRRGSKDHLSSHRLIRLGHTKHHVVFFFYKPVQHSRRQFRRSHKNDTHSYSSSPSSRSSSSTSTTLSMKRMPSR